MTSIDQKRILLNDFIKISKEITSKYHGNGGQTDKQTYILTDKNSEVENLLMVIEGILLFGLKTSLFGNVLGTSEMSLFQKFAYQHLTKDEQLRFSSYKNLWTERGKVKALIRNALNERCLERYFLSYLSAENLNEFYEPFAVIRDSSASAILPKLAADLSSILFAIPIDVPELNVPSSKPSAVKPEPIIAVPDSSKIVKSGTSSRKLTRNIDEFPETVKPSEILVHAHVDASYPPPYESYDQRVVVPSFSDKISISTESSTESAPFNVKDGDSISDSSSSTEEDFASNETFEEPEKQIRTESQIDNEVLTQKQRERIIELENQVRDLTLENSRLKNLLNTSKVNTLANIQVSIPRAVLQKTKTKNYYIYEINLRSKNGSESWTIFKRYRDFHKLHKNLKKQYLQIKVLDFPPKRKIGNLDFDFVEERRQRLQVYIRHVLQNIPDLASCDCRKLLESKCYFFKS